VRCLVVGGSGWGNVGDDLIADRIVSDQLARGNSVVLAGGASRPADLPAAVKHVRLIGSWRARLGVLRQVLLADEVHIGGGGLLADRVPEFYRPFYRVARLAWALRVPYRLVAVGVSTARRPETVRHYRWMFDHAVTASVRDEASHDRAVRSLTSRPPVVVDDPVLWSRSRPRGDWPAHDVLVNLRPWDLEAHEGAASSRRTAEVVDAVAEALNSAYGPRSHVGLVSMSACSTTTTRAPWTSWPRGSLAGSVGTTAVALRRWRGWWPQLEASCPCDCTSPCSAW